MKYLKKYNENQKLSLKDFSEMYLVNLLDDGFDIQSQKTSLAFLNRVVLTRLLSFTWANIKDSFIPYIQMLDGNYKIYSISFIFLHKDNQFISVDSIKNDEIDDNDSILYIIVDVDIKHI